MSYQSNLFTLRTQTKNLWKIQATPITPHAFLLKYSFLFKNLFWVLNKFNVYFITLALSQKLNVFIYIYFTKNRFKRNYLKLIILYLNIFFKNHMFKFFFINIKPFLPARIRIERLTKYIFKKLHTKYNQRLRINYKRAIKFIIFGFFFCNTKLIMLSLQHILEHSPYKRQWGPIYQIKRILRIVYNRHVSMTGIRLRLKGKLSGRRRKTIHKWFLGNVQTVIFKNIILYDQIDCITAYGSIGVKLWLVYTKNVHYSSPVDPDEL